MSTEAPGRDKPFVAVVGIDGSNPSLAALTHACALARARGGIVHALRAVAVETVAFLDTPLDLHEERQQLRALCHERAGGVAQVVAHVAVERPERALEQLAREVDADVIVVGTSRRGPLRHLLWGATAERLVRRASRPVVIVPEGDDREGDHREAQMRHET